MTRREMFFKTMRREMEGYVPFEFDLSPSLHDQFEKRTGVRSYRDYYDMPMRYVSVETRSTLEENEKKYKRFFKNPRPDLLYTEWGIGYHTGSVEHFVKMLPAMEHFTTLKEFEEFPYPTADDFKWDDLAERIAALKAKDCVVFASMACTVWEVAYVLRGMEQTMVDMMLDPELIDYHMDRITEIKCEFARRYVAAGVDAFQFGDDIATQRDMLMSLDLWRRFLKPRSKRVIDTVKALDPNLMIQYHSCGNCTAAIPELMEIGVDILNPVQPECMDPIELKRIYGDRLSFWGAIGTQTTMPFGTTEEVDAKCKQMIDVLGRGGGLLLAPSHVLEPEVPFENIEAFVGAVKKYSRIKA